MKKEAVLLYGITNESVLKDGYSLENAVEDAIRGGITMLQFRDKTASDQEYVEKARRLHEITHAKGIPLILNDRVHLVKECQAEGVHVGQSDSSVLETRRLLGSDYIIGATAHNLEEGISGELEGADYLGIGAAFGSKTKLDAKAFDIREYATITQEVEIPICAIGGINGENMQELAGMGLSGVAIISGIFGARDITAETSALKAEAVRLFGMN